MATGKQLATVSGDEYPVLVQGSEEASAMQEVLVENFGDGGVAAFDLDRIVMPSGGGIAWEVPTLEGADSTQELTGVIVAWAPPRAYWEKDLEDSEEGGTPPDCSSDDGKIGFGVFGQGSEANPTGACDICPMNEWDTDPKGRGGKACKETRLLFMLLPGRVLPVTVSLPPTSIQPLRKYLLRLAGQATPFYGVVTTFRLRKVDEGKVKYSVVEPAVKAVLDPVTKAQAKAYGEQIKTAFAVQRGLAEQAARDAGVGDDKNVA